MSTFAIDLLSGKPYLFVPTIGDSTGSTSGIYVNITGDTMTGKLSVPQLEFQTGATITGHKVGSVHWNETDATTERHLKHGVTLQDGQETQVFGIAYEDLVDGDAVSIYGFTSGGTPILGKTDIATFGTEFYSGNDVAVMTSSATAGNTCYATIFGKIRSLDTSMYSAGTTLWLSNTVRGALTNIRPIYPEQTVPVAFVARQDATEGEIIVNPANDLSPQLNNLKYIDDYFIGTFVDKISMNVFESGGTVYIRVEKDVVSGSTDFRVLVGTDDILTFSSQTIALNAGTESVPILNYVSIIRTGIAVQTGWFTGDELDTTGEFAAIATVLVQDPPNVAIEGVYKLHGWIDRLITDDRGDNVKGTERLRQVIASWDNGVLPTVTQTSELATVDRIDISTTRGIIYQKNRNVMPVRTTVGDGIIIHVADGVPNYYPVNHFGEITGQTDGTAWNNGNRVNFVVWGISSQNEVDSKIMVNTCSGVYGSDANAINDPNNYSDFNVDKDYLGTAFLICRITAQYSTTNNGSWSIIQVEDLRGRLPNTSGGGAAGAGGTIAVKNSIERDVDLIYQLTNDVITPTGNTFYGADSGGTRGWYSVPLDNTFTSFDVITGTTTLNNTHNNHVIHASGITGTTGYTITISSGVTIGFSTTIVSFIPDAIITIEGQGGEILSRGNADTLVNQYGAATIQYIGNNQYTLIGDIT